MKPKPHPSGLGDYPQGHINKSFMAQSLNKMTRLYGGRSGYRSDARKPRKLQLVGDFKSVGELPRKSVVKTVLCVNGKNISQKRFISKTEAFSIPFCTKLTYIDKWGETMTIENTNVQ